MGQTVTDFDASSSPSTLPYIQVSPYLACSVTHFMCVGCSLSYGWVNVLQYVSFLNVRVFHPLLFLYLHVFVSCLFCMQCGMNVFFFVSFTIHRCV
jgi:hypothetical protein